MRFFLGNRDICEEKLKKRNWFNLVFSKLLKYKIKSIEHIWNLICMVLIIFLRETVDFDNEIRIIIYFIVLLYFI